MTNITSFGTTAQGTPVQRITLTAGDLTVSLLTLGAAVQGVWLKGVRHSLTIGSEALTDYEGPLHYHGTLVGPVVNRITGSTAVIRGVRHHFAPDPGDRNIVHSGPFGTYAKVWILADHSATHATLTLDLPAGEGGFPGNRHVRATFRVVAPATLRMEVVATTDAVTLINFANHSYWNLDGSQSWAGHTLQIAADSYLPATGEILPTGQIAPVAGTPFDFRQPKIGTPGNPPLDTNFCLADARRGLTDVLVMTGRSGVRMTLATTEPGVQIYDNRAPAAPGHPAYHGLAIEAQSWPDSPGRAGFPSIELAAGEVYDAVTEWRFDRVSTGGQDVAFMTSKG